MAKISAEASEENAVFFGNGMILISLKNLINLDFLIKKKTVHSFYTEVINE